MLSVFAFLIGLIVGSFLNVCICRLPERRSIAWPRSSCPHCGKRLAPRDLVPVLSYLWLGGRCRYCREPISIQYPIVELATGLLYAAIVAAHGVSLVSLKYLIFVSLLIIITGTDINTRLIPNAVTYPGMAIGLILSLFIPGISFLRSIVGLLVCGGVVYLLAWASKGGMGGGDIKLMGMMGAFLGWDAGLLALFVGALLGSVVGIVRIASGKQKRRDPMPFGPFLAVGGLISAFFAPSILSFIFLQ
jgi:leader peptidase (prepilin peptidase)/N-methyltransferase